MDIPPYIQSDEAAREYYNEILNDVLRTGLSDNGWTVPQITTANLTVNTFLWPDGTTQTVAAFMPNGTLWYVTDASPQIYVGKINGSLVKFTTAAYP